MRSSSSHCNLAAPLDATGVGGPAGTEDQGVEADPGACSDAAPHSDALRCDRLRHLPQISLSSPQALACLL